MMVPMEVGLVAYVWEMRVLHLSKTFLPLILPNIANAFGVFWMTQYIGDAFPCEPMSSWLDGCTDMGIFLKWFFQETGAVLRCRLLLSFNPLAITSNDYD